MAFRDAKEGFVQDDSIVLKFGHSVLTTPADLANAVHEIYRWYRQGMKVIAVVSAIGETTNGLIREAHAISRDPEPHALAQLLATGERSAAALLGLSLDRSGIPSRVLDPQEIDLTVEGTALESIPLRADSAAARALLAEYPVLVIPGFFGLDVQGRTRLLGRGGSDLSAVFLAQAFGAQRCRLLKDVDGVYDADPALPQDHSPHRFSTISYSDAHRVAGPLIQAKAIDFLEKHRATAEIAALARAYASTVHAGSTESAAPVHAIAGGLHHHRSSVLLLGLGTVGFGVYQRLLRNPSHFHVLGVLARDRDKHIGAGVPAELLHTDPERVACLAPDLVVDALPGIEPSLALARHFLNQGIPVISANKRLICEHGLALGGLAERVGTNLNYAAAVGGSAPLIEAVDRAGVEGHILALIAVLNGTCNFVLDRCAEGESLEQALVEARAAGFAEQDPSDDLNGKDAERKLRILCRHAFDAELEQVAVDVLDERIARRARTAAERGKRLRQVARASYRNTRLIASIDFEELELSSPLGSLKREWNGLEIQCSPGTYFIKGRGAGRWPTAEAVMADIFEAHRRRTTDSHLHAVASSAGGAHELGSALAAES